MDEDSEFREMVMKRLESSGFMLKMRAKLRAHIYHAIDQDLTTSPNRTHTAATTTDASNSQDYSKTEMPSKPEPPADEAMALYLVQDLLDCLNLNCTSSVFKMETGINSKTSRSDIIKALKISIDETHIAADNTTTNSDSSVEESIVGQNNKNNTNKPLLFEVLRKLNSDVSASYKLADQPESPQKLSESTSDEYNDQTFITSSAQNTTANQTSESL